MQRLIFMALVLLAVQATAFGRGEFTVTLANWTNAAVRWETARLYLDPVGVDPTWVGSTRLGAGRFAVGPGGDGVPSGRPWEGGGRGAPLAATIELPPGRYWVTLDDGRTGQKHLLLRPIRVPKDGDLTLALDLSKARPWIVAPRTLEGQIPSAMGQHSALHIAGAIVHMPGRLHVTEIPGAQAEPPFAHFYTFDEAPTSARFIGVAGASGWQVPLLSSKDGNDREKGSADAFGPSLLAAHLPNAEFHGTDFHPIAGGPLRGFLSTSDRAQEWPADVGITGFGLEPRGFEAWPPFDSFGVHLRGDRTTGVVVEEAEPFGVMVRDWFEVNPAGIQLGHGGEGHCLLVRSDLPTTVALVVWPGRGTPEDGLPELTCYIEPGESRTLWIPSGATRITGHPGEEPCKANRWRRHRWEEVDKILDMPLIPGPGRRVLRPEARQGSGRRHVVPWTKKQDR